MLLLVKKKDRKCTEQPYTRIVYNFLYKIIHAYEI